MDRFVLRIASDAREIEVALPADAALSSLIPGLVQMCEGGEPEEGDSRTWHLQDELGRELPEAATVRELGLDEGSLLRLVALAPAAGGWVPPPSVAQAHPAPDPGEAAAGGPAPGSDTGPDSAQPGPDPAPAATAPAPAHAESELPSPVPLAGRLKAVAGALVSSRPEESPADADPAAVDRLVLPEGPGAIERAKHAWEATDYRRQLEAVITTPRLTRAAVIAVASPKGGVGKTTTTILLGTILATLRTDRVVAVDTDPDWGTLGRSFAPEKPMYVDDLAQILDQPALSATMLDRFLSRAAHGLMILPAPSDPDRMESLGREDYERVIDRLREMVGILVLDCGAGLRAPATQAALAAADQVVLVTDADPATASLVADAAHHMRERNHVLVVNKTPRRGSRLDLERLASDVPAAGAVIEIDIDPVAASRASLGQFNWSVAQDGWHISARELAAHLAAGWERLGLTG